jgi:hypothetical protein
MTPFGRHGGIRQHFVVPAASEQSAIRLASVCKGSIIALAPPAAPRQYDVFRKWLKGETASEWSATGVSSRAG